MIDSSENAIEAKILFVLCIFVLCGILTAGLWPFHAPRNNVKWLTKTNGLRFGRYGTVLSSQALAAPSSQYEEPCSIEIWLRSYRSYDTNTILAFYRPGNTRQFSLHQSDSDLALQLGLPDEHIQAKTAGIVYGDDLFRTKELLLVAIASGGEGTRIYVNGVLAKNIPNFRLSTLDCTGQLVLGTSPVVNDTWSGELRGLAIYRQELSPAQVARHFETWTTEGRPELGQDEHAPAFYAFDEHQGGTVHDRSGSGIDLHIPERYMILSEKLLEPPWKEFYPAWSYWKNVGINIGGFLPLGFCFCAYLTTSRLISRPVLATIILGAATSLTIELPQAFLPTRDSGMTDLITNTLGTGLGALLYLRNSTLFQEVLRRARLAIFGKISVYPSVQASD
jgi:VanZ like protein/concanavalin A-like lectin/glucanase superfamily protein